MLLVIIMHGTLLQMMPVIDQNFVSFTWIMKIAEGQAFKRAGF